MAGDGSNVEAYPINVINLGDYAVGDGSTDDTTAVGNAISAAVTAGQPLYVPEGIYLVSSAIDCSGVSIFGFSRFKSIFKADTGGSWGSGGHASATAVLYYREDSDFTVQNIGVDGNSEDAAGISCFGGSNVTFSNLYVKDTTDCGIQFWGNDATGNEGVSEGAIIGNIVENCMWNLVFDGQVDNCLMSDNISLNADKRHISLDTRQSIDEYDARSNLVSNNILSGEANSGTNAEQAIVVYGDEGYFGEISNNYIYDCSAKGIYVEYMGGKISGNIIHGISAKGTVGIEISNNLSGLAVKNNVIYNFTTGISGTSGSTHWLNVQGNLLNNCTTYLTILNSSSESNVITGNYNNSGGVDGSGQGWVYAGDTWTYASDDDPTYTFTISGDKTDKYSAGMKIKLTDSGTQYFIITKVAYSSPNTTVTVYGGTDYDLSSGAITNPYYSTQKAPQGFPLDPDKWTEETTDSSDDTQANATKDTWYNVGSISISVPIGCWNLSYSCYVAPVKGTADFYGQNSTLSTANNSESESDFTSVTGVNGGATGMYGTNSRQSYIDISSKTTYYLNQMQDFDTNNDVDLRLRGAYIPTRIRAICAYL